MMYRYVCNCLVGYDVARHVVGWHIDSSVMMVNNLMNL